MIFVNLVDKNINRFGFLFRISLPTEFQFVVLVKIH